MMMRRREEPGKWTGRQFRIGIVAIVIAVIPILAAILVFVAFRGAIFGS